ncbi:MAG: hypothetical protein JJ892_13550 [Balneola sp.]|nr:hypothetical protein [Balneola sp.]MBO6649533.1 hypothetical protein [Balneola sp.]MBO6711350.1 hypothetical protein [Balneola sp.]MBO6801296.1 hypothetical protein [Balneola sp.]MBO6869286.1 hypothetical protein [Balneola sp.]
MLARLARVLKSFLGAAGVAASPIKAITGIVVSIIIPYLLYAFLGGFGIALAIFGIGWGIWYFVKKKDQ